MGMLPWEDLFYNISGKSQRLNTLYNSYLSTRDLINTEGDLLRTRVEDLQLMSVQTKALLLNITLSDLSDDHYHTVIQKNSVDKIPPVKQSTLALALEGISEFCGTLELGKLVMGLAKLAGFPPIDQWIGQAASRGFNAAKGMFSSDAIETANDSGITTEGDAASDSITNAAAEAEVEIGTEEAIEAVAEADEAASLAAASEAMTGLQAAGEIVMSTGPEIIVALGIDAFINLLAGAVEEEAIEKQTDLLNKAMDVLVAYADKLTERVQKAEQYTLDTIADFKAVMDELEKIEKPAFSYAFNQDITEVDNWKEAMNAACQQYMYLGSVRDSFDRRISNFNEDNPGQSIKKEKFKSWISGIIDDRDPSMPEDMAMRFVRYVIEHSEALTQLNNQK